VRLSGVPVAAHENSGTHENSGAHENSGTYRGAAVAVSASEIQPIQTEAVQWPCATAVTVRLTMEEIHTGLCLCRTGRPKPEWYRFGGKGTSVRRLH
jgi:hypothetical protein